MVIIAHAKRSKIKASGLQKKKKMVTYYEWKTKGLQWNWIAGFEGVNNGVWLVW